MDGERGAIREEFATLIARPFPQAVDGKLIGFQFDSGTRVLTVELEDAGEGEHILSAPTVVFPDGVQVRCDGALVETVVAYPGRVGVSCSGTVLTLEPAPVQ